MWNKLFKKNLVRCTYRNLKKKESLPARCKREGHPMTYFFKRDHLSIKVLDIVKYTINNQTYKSNFCKKVFLFVACQHHCPDLGSYNSVRNTFCEKVRIKIRICYTNCSSRTPSYMFLNKMKINVAKGFPLFLQLDCIFGSLWLDQF